MKSLLFVILIISLGLVAYQPSFDAEFVYDDNRQIEANQLIQNPQFYRQALLSDVWAFKADGETAVSNYWRPTFVAWMMVNYQLVGLDPLYWHVINVLLHFLVGVLLYFLLRAWSASIGLALTTVALFILHPVHVESVAWVAGSPDILFALFISSALLCWQYFVKAIIYEPKHGLLAVLALLFYALALGAKEVAILFPPLFILLAYWQGDVTLSANKPSHQVTNRKLMMISLGFVVLAIAYFIVRYQVLGFFSKPQSESLTFNHFILTLPQVTTFYWQQLLLPLSAGANFPIRVVSEFSATQWLITTVFSLFCCILMLLLGRKSRFQTLGLLLLILPILPALNLFAFHHEQLVHHRYLYFSVLGFLMILLPAWQVSMGEKNASLAKFILALLLIGCTYQSFQFSKMWQDNRSLWLKTTQKDPDSAFNWQQMANVYLEAKELPTAIAAFQRSLAVEVTPRSLYGLAKALHYSGKHQEAMDALQLSTSDYREQIDMFLGYQIYELYAMVFSATKQLPAAEEILRKAMNELPAYQVLLADKLAVVLYLQNKKAQALQLLIEVEQAAMSATHLSAKLVFFRMAMLYDESKQTSKAKQSFKVFLSATQSSADASFTQYQQIAQEYLRKN